MNSPAPKTTRPTPDERRKSKGGLACKWMGKKLVHGIGEVYGKPYQLLPWHREFLWRWYELDPPAPGAWWYTEALVGAESGAVKTEFFAALAMLEMAGPKPFRRNSPVITMAAASFDQAGELFQQAQIMAGGVSDAPVTHAPLYGLFKVYDKEIQYASGAPGLIQRVAARASTAEGGKETLLLADELHEWHGQMSRVYDVRAKSLTKRWPHPGRVCGMSTAGRGRGGMPPKDTDSLLWRLYARGLMGADDPASRYLFDWREAPQAIEQARKNERALRAALQGMRAADVAWSVDVRLREILTYKIPWSEALRYYFNRFVAFAEDSWLNDIPGVWDECYDAEAIPADGSDVVVGVDMALRQDSVGVIIAGRLPDGRIAWLARHWAPSDGKIDHLDVFNWISGTAVQRWNVKAVCYDPRFFEVPAQILQDTGVPAVEFPQSPERLVPADQLVYELVVDHRVVHPGDPVLSEHVGNAAWRESDRGRYWSKGKSAGHIDLLRAASMATWELMTADDEADYWLEVVEPD